MGAWVSASPTAGTQWAYDLGCDFVIPASTTFSFVSVRDRREVRKTHSSSGHYTPGLASTHRPPVLRPAIDSSGPQIATCRQQQVCAAEAPVYPPLTLAQPCVSLEWSPLTRTDVERHGQEMETKLWFVSFLVLAFRPSLGLRNPARLALHAVDVLRNLPVGTSPHAPCMPSPATQHDQMAGPTYSLANSSATPSP